MTSVTLCSDISGIIILWCDICIFWMHYDIIVDTFLVAKFVTDFWVLLTSQIHGYFFSLTNLVILTTLLQDCCHWNIEVSAPVCVLNSRQGNLNNDAFPFTSLNFCLGQIQGLGEGTYPIPNIW